MDAPLAYITGMAPVGHDDLWIAGVMGSAAGGHDAFAHYVSGGWTIVPAPAGVHVAGLRALSPTDIWAEGSVTDPTTYSTAPAIMHYDGASWSRTPLSGDRTAQSVEMLSATDGWAFTYSHDDSSPAHVLRAEHFTNGAWQSVAWPFDSVQSVIALTRVADGTYWAIGGYVARTVMRNAPNSESGGSVLLHYANGSWSQYGQG
jgi:hypothetical protein